MTIGRRCLAVVALFVCALLLGMAAAQEPQTPTRIRVSQGVSQDLLIQRVPPHYPEAARSARISGIVVLQAIIDKDGAVQSLKVVQGHPLLIGAAMDAVKQWRYKPYYLNGQPIEVDTLITVGFDPDEAQTTSATFGSPQAPTAQEQTPGSSKPPLRAQLMESQAELLIARQVDPVYPELARIARIQGDVVLRVLLNPDGALKEVSVVQGHPMLAPAAMDAVKQWRFKPFSVVAPRWLGAHEDEEIEAAEFRAILNFDGAEAKVISPGIIVPAEEKYRKAEFRPGLLIHRVQSKWPPEVDVPNGPPYVDPAIVRVVAELTVDSTGVVTEVKPLGGNPKLFAATVETVKQWRYVPGFVNGEPVATIHRATVQFTPPKMETQSVP